jgi:Flp pilus assembly protein TadD
METREEAPAEGGDPGEQAEVAKTQGNEAFGAKDYERALALFTKAILLSPKGAYFCNRSATHLALKQEEWALEDALAAVQVEPNNAKGHLRLGHALAACWRRQEARQAYEKCVALAGPSDAVDAALRGLDKLKPVEPITAEALEAEVEQLAPKRHGLAQVQELAHKYA